MNWWLIKEKCLLQNEAYCHTFQDSDTMGKWDWLLQFQPPLDYRTIYYLFSLWRQFPMMVWERGVWMVWGPFYKDNFLSCVAQGSVICDTAHKRRNTKGEAAAMAFFTASIWQANSHSTLLQEPCSNFLLQKDTRLQISFLVSRPPVLWHPLLRNSFQNHVW